MPPCWMESPLYNVLVHKASNHKEFFIDLWNLDDLQ